VIKGINHLRVFDRADYICGSAVTAFHFSKPAQGFILAHGVVPSRHFSLPFSVFPTNARWKLMFQ
jgi:hypothetical protein